MITARAVLLSSTALMAPRPEPQARIADRIAIARAYLGRDPIVLVNPLNPFNSVPFFIESEPTDWPDFLALADQRGGVEGLVREMRRSASERVQ